MTILVCGEALFDFFQTDVANAGGLTFDARVGGSPFNVAVGVARLGGRAALLTGISTDFLGARLFQQLEDEGVGTDFVVRNGRRTTVSLVGLDARGSPDYSFYGVGSADCALTPEDMPELPSEVAALHFGSYSIAVSPVADALAGLAERAGGRFVSLDPNVRPTIEPDMSVWRQRIDRLRKHTDMIKVSREDLGMLYPGEAADAVALSWVADGCKLVVVTSGSANIEAFRPDRRIAIAPPTVDVVDAVGAGDAFQASLLAGLQAQSSFSVLPADLSDDVLRTLIGKAAEAGAITCGRRGADLPRSSDWM